MAATSDFDSAIAWLRSPAAIRERCAMVLAVAEAGDLEHFAYDESRMDAAADYVVDTIREAYPDLNIPPHSRWRHFTVGGVDRWANLVEGLRDVSADEVARIRFDLTVTSVLLDAGAGTAWRYRDRATGESFARSEGLAVASFDMFASGLFSADVRAPLRADAAALAAIESSALAAAFQADDANPLVGLDGRAALLRQLGEALTAAPHLFGAPPRIANLFDYLKARACDGALPAAAILGAVLEGLGAIWPGRVSLGGVNLGDVWRHPAARANDATDGLVPFHKLSQWLTYSLVEPLEAAGIGVIELDALSGLPEYRNGGLLVDLGVLQPKHPLVLESSHTPDSEVIVEWRALTVALIDRLAARIRDRLGADGAGLSLAAILEGGTWRAGRRIAAERRPDGGPPIRLESDGTVF